MKDILKINNLGKTYGSGNNKVLALKNIDLTIKEKEFVAVMGPSGSGKSTLLNVISTIDRPSSGEVYIDGSNINKISDKKLAAFRRDKLGFIFQSFNLLDTLTVEENIALPLTISKNINKSEIKQRAANISNRLGIREILHKYPYEISGGQKQRTAACRAIIGNPSLILADEPTGALDSKSAENLLDTLNFLNEKEDATIMMVTHDPLAASYSKRVIFIKDGNLAYEIERKGSKEEFLKKILEVIAYMNV
ncbi:MAG: ABC transporter ATP-binding protein [Clostridium chrysemydis]|uniref:ABC transporter ATP-binding protein n=1 Tax=Clostridium TaxID=1485 RepID=UPI0021526451|nr:ABC transporter ATP-binding protein [Clostridium sp. LY3-2]MCR6515949.1 ABC transporter ATP-binding protein [Clostridium sp. LY3-2]